MIPIHWRYLLVPYLKTFFLSAISFIVLIVVIRLKGIANIAALGASWKILGLYTLYQVPYILPLALTFSSLLGSYLVFHRMSVSHELTALRASGLSFRQIITPLLLCNAILASLNFFIVSEVTTTGKIRASMMKHEMNTFSPIVMLQNNWLLESRGIYADLNIVNAGEKASDVLIAYLNPSNHRISLFVASQLEQINDILLGKDVSMISTSDPEKSSDLDNLIIENQKELKTPTSVLSWYFSPHQYKPKSAYLKLSLLLIHLKKSREAYRKELARGGSIDKLNKLKHDINIPKSEIVRRISLALSAFSLSFLGITFGTRIARTGGVKGIVAITALTSFSLACFFSAKDLHHHFALSSFLYLGPHFITISICIYTLRRLTRGYS